MHDFIVLWASTRRGGCSLAEIARREVGPVAGATAAHRHPVHHRHRARRPRPGRRQRAQRERLGHVHDRHDDPDRALHGHVHVPLAEGQIAEATVIGVIGLLLAVVLGKPFAATAAGAWFQLTQHQLVVAMAIYGFIASVLPVWLLLARATISART